MNTNIKNFFKSRALLGASAWSVILLLLFPSAVMGQASVLEKLTDFTAAGDRSQIRGGSNIQLSRTYESDETAVLKLVFEKKKIDDVLPDHNWFTLKQPIQANERWAEADGILVELALNKDRRWWFGLSVVTEDGHQYSYGPLRPMGYTEAFDQRIVRFSDFKSKTAATVLDPRKITELSISGTGNVGVVYLRDVQLFKTVENEQLLSFAADSRFGGHIFERGEPVELAFKKLANVNGDFTFAYTVTDFNETVVAEADLRTNPGESIYTVPLSITASGYYEVRAYMIDADGQKSEFSCIQQQGNVPGAFGTFAIMPKSVQENIDAMTEVGEDAFFGLHNSRHYFNLHELMGMPWMLVYARWEHLEPQKPVRRTPDSVAPWVAQRLKKLNAPLPPYIFAHTSLLAAQTGAPKWAQREDKVNPPQYANEADLNAFLRDYITFHKKLTPHMKHRTYGVLWEPEIYTPEYMVNKHVPVYQSIDTLVDIMGKTRKLIKEQDPDSIVLGPTSMWCYGLDWWERFFKAGLLEEVDQISSHFYTAAPPENARIPENLLGLRELMVQYGGHEYGIYNTEAGFKSKIGNKHMLTEHAAWCARYAMILKGEGLKRHLHFFPFDGGSADSVSGGYGICFYTGDVEKFSYNSTEFSPKPATPALATCSSELLGATPVRHLRDWGSNIWGYVFERKGEPVITIWQPFKEVQIPVFVGDVDTVEVTDVMGVKSVIPVTDGFVQLQLGPNPLYINGADAAVYLSNEFIKQASVHSYLPEITPGQSREISIPEKLSAHLKTGSLSTWGGLSLELTESNKLRVSVPSGLPEMCIPIFLNDGDAGSWTQWVRVGSELKVTSMHVADQQGELGLAVELENYTQQLKQVRLVMQTEFSVERIISEVQIEGSSRVSVFLSFGPGVQLSGDSVKPLDVDLKVEVEDGASFEATEQIYFLTAYAENGDTSENRIFPDQVRLNGAGASGHVDEVELQFGWNADALQIDVTVRDDVFEQSATNFERLWQEDSIQFAFDTDPASQELYNPLGGIYTKKISQIALALVDGEVAVYRHSTHNEAELPLGDVSQDGFRIQVQRDDELGVTTYQCEIPWKLIGLDHVTSGQSIGISFLLNDSDGKDSERTTQSLFDGIKNGQDYTQFGRLTLR